MTYIWTGKRWAYLTVVLDLFTWKVVGCALSTSPDTALTLKVLQMTWEMRGQPKGLMSHNGSNNASVSFHHH
ncbi:DDE-type integrase/transposase/recombinase [Proteus mirabilis]|uniref:DDE-type integrase/transposase/recombinase n=1 Tax=Proteus mirabilis TaxID=584 RepID=UPI0039B4B016